LQRSEQLHCLKVRLVLILKTHFADEAPVNPPRRVVGILAQTPQEAGGPKRRRHSLWT
jgi:hypothetical protein